MSEPAEKLAQVCGLESDILERFIELIQKGYPQAEEAIHFLETQTDVSGINVGITNLRDVLSHFCTVVSHPEWDRERKMAQCANAEEHIRRSIMDSYAKAVTLRSDMVFKMLEEYKEKVLPVKGRLNPILSTAPELSGIYAQLEEIGTIRNKARQAKGRNSWDAEWEEGIKMLTDACLRLRRIHQELESFVIRATQADQDRKNKRLAVWAIVATILVGILGVACSYLFYLWTIKA